MDNFFGFLDISVELQTDTYLPVLPTRSIAKHLDLGIIYPTGQIRGIYFSEEIKYAIKQGYKLQKIYSGYEFIEKSCLFDEYVDELYKKRQATSNPILKAFYKKAINSLYGRFATEFIKEINIGNTVYYEYKRDNVAISSAISSYARIRVYEKIKPYIDALIYWDTDGVFLKRPLNSSEISTTLGAFRLVSEIKEVYFIATKFYFYVTKSGTRKYIVRGISQNEYYLSKQVMIKAFNELIRTGSFFNKAFEYTILLKNKITGEIISKSFHFNHKRYVMKHATKPYKIKCLN